MKKIYIYPVSFAMDNLTNPYLKDYTNNILKQNICILNKNFSGNPLVAFYKYFNKSEVFIFHFLENVPFYRFGILQFILAIIAINSMKIFNKKFIFYIHNKKPHRENHFLKNYLSKIIFNNSIKHATKIFTYCNEGKLIAGKYQYKCMVNQLPIKNRYVNVKKIDYTYDVLIWGEISGYKGVLEFLEFLNIFKKDIKILIHGKIRGNELKNKILSYCSESIVIKDEFISNDDLICLRSKVKFVLFPFIKDTVLSSSSLTDSLSYGYKVIGPNTGSFKDLSKKNIGVLVFNDYAEIFDIIKYDVDNSSLEEYIIKHSWFNETKNLIKKL